MSDLIPKALMVNIWIRLPIRSAVRFRCVSKSWCSTLSDPDFISKNLTFSDPNPHDLLVFVSGRYCVVSYESLEVSPISGRPPSGVYERVLSSCDGLICSYEHYGVDVSVWNPATGETMIPPPFHHVDGHYADFQTIGFGFDAKNNDYKIVKIFSVWKHDNIRKEAFVHSLRSNCWRKLEEPNISEYRFCPRRTSSSIPSVEAYRDGTFYWLADGCSIVSFDMSEEVFESIRIPKDPSLCIDSIFWFKDGSLGISTYKSEEFRDEKSVFQIWALLDVGVAQSWTRLLTIDDSWVTGLYHCFGFWRNEYLFRTGTDQLIMCDPLKRETKAIEIEGGEYPMTHLGFPIRYRASHKPLCPCLICSQSDA